MSKIDELKAELKELFRSMGELPEYQKTIDYLENNYEGEALEKMLQSYISSSKNEDQDGMEFEF